jgi:hypothetical protein
MKLDEEKKLYRNCIWSHDLIYNFVVDKFFIWNCLESQNIVWVLIYWNLKFSSNHMDVSMTNTKVVVLNTIYKVSI